jgi:hypothetical protein
VGYWDRYAKIIYIEIETGEFPEGLECYVGYSFFEPFSSGFIYWCAGDPNIFIPTGYYPEMPASVEVWLRPLCVGYPPGEKIKLAVPIQIF